MATAYDDWKLTPPDQGDVPESILEEAREELEAEAEEAGDLGVTFFLVVDAAKPLSRLLDNLPQGLLSIGEENALLALSEAADRHADSYETTIELRMQQHADAEADLAAEAAMERAA